MTTTFPRIQRIDALISEINPGQIAVEPTVDSHLLFKMSGYKDYDGNPYKNLSKDQKGRLLDLGLIGPTTTGTIGILQHDTSGNVFGGKVTVDQLNEYIIDGSIGVPPLVEDQLLFGSADEEIEQSALLTWDDTELYVYGDIEIDGHAIMGVTHIDFELNGAIAERRLCWDDDEGYLVSGMKGGTVNLQIGGEVLLRGMNDSGDVLSNGTPLQISGSLGNNPLFEEVDISLGKLCYYAGVATEEIDDNQHGYSNVYGLVRDLGTIGLTSGVRTFYGTDNALTHTQPPAGNQTIIAGYPTRIHATEGVLLHIPRSIPWLSNLSDVNAREQTHDDGDILAWSTSGGYWDLSATVSSISTNENAEQMAGHLRVIEGENILVDALTAGDGWQISANIVSQKYYADTAVVLDTGTPISGDGDSTHKPHDDVSYNVQEVGGTPGFLFTFNFSSVVSFDKVQFYVLYDGVGSHNVNINLINQVTTNPVTIANFTLAPTWQLLDIEIPDSTVYIDGSGNVELQIDHTSSGLPSHDVHVDYTALVKNVAGSEAQASLAEGAIGFGSASNLLTGDATKLAYILADETVKLFDGVALGFGDSVDTEIKFNTSQTENALTVGLSPVTRSMIVCDLGDTDTDFNLPAVTNPTLSIMAADAVSAHYLRLSHTGANAYLRAGTGSIAFGDEYLTASTNWTSPQPLYSSTVEADAIHALLGDTEGSIAASILAAGVTRDGAYDFGGDGLGRIATIDAGPSSDIGGAAYGGVLKYFSATNESSTYDLMQINNDSDGATIRLLGSIGEGQDPGSELGHQIRVEDGMLSMVNHTPGDTYSSTSFARVYRRATNPDAYISVSEIGGWEDVGDSSASIKVQSSPGVAGAGPGYANASISADGVSITANERIAIHGRMAHFHSSPIAASGGAVELDFDVSDQRTIDCNDQASITVTIKEPDDTPTTDKRSFGVVRIEQGNTTPTTSFTWVSDGSATVTWLTPSAISPTLDSVTYVEIWWEYLEWRLMVVGAGSVSGLAQYDILFGSSSGGIDQDSNLTYTSAGDIDLDGGSLVVDDGEGIRSEGDVNHDASVILGSNALIDIIAIDTSGELAASKIDIVAKENASSSITPQISIVSSAGTIGKVGNITLSPASMVVDCSTNFADNLVRNIIQASLTEEQTITSSSGSATIQWFNGNAKMTVDENVTSVSMEHFATGISRMTLRLIFDGSYSVSGFEDSVWAGSAPPVSGTSGEEYIITFMFINKVSGDEYYGIVSGPFS